MALNNNVLLAKTNSANKKMLSWLNHQDSLTLKLSSELNDVNLNVLSTFWLKPSWWDRYLLNIDSQQLLQREITISSKSINYWYARTVIPKHTYDADTLFFDRLENESLMHLIFNEPKVNRSQLIYYPISKDCIEYYWLPKAMTKNINGSFWVRLSEFKFLDQYLFYLCEVLSEESLLRL